MFTSLIQNTDNHLLSSLCVLLRVMWGTNSTLRSVVNTVIGVQRKNKPKGIQAALPKRKTCIGCGWYRDYILLGRRHHQTEGRGPATLLNGKTPSFPFSSLIPISMSQGNFYNASVVATVLSGYFQVQVPSIL